jgi:hypothetical protein
MKTLDINAREWFDKVNGNSYFSAEIVINYGTESERKYFLPFQYGYGDHYQYQAFELLQDNCEIPDNINHLWQLRDTEIILRTNKIKTLKRNLKQENY